jgi:hypothetical protein
MQRRTFMGLTAGAATALAFEPGAVAEEQERKSLVVYPDPAVEVIDPRFENRWLNRPSLSIERSSVMRGSSWSADSLCCLTAVSPG